TKIKKTSPLAAAVCRETPHQRSHPRLTGFSDRYNPHPAVPLATGGKSCRIQTGRQQERRLKVRLRMEACPLKGALRAGLSLLRSHRGVP
ncbi:MAG: hypothetical protein VX084_10120, partial [Planctomycetota bacterium]|nr:hypothetical protein [Planctomycetota bacterium]